MRKETDVKRSTTMVVALVVGCVLTASVSAAGTARDPLSLVLQRADFPAKTKLTSARNVASDKKMALIGLPSKSADYLAEVPLGETEALWVSGRVVVFASAAQARLMFSQYKRDLAVDLKLARTVRLPAFGAEQFAFLQTDPDIRAQLRVRLAAVLWSVEIKWAGTETYTRAQALAELNTYAAKLKRRVGRG
jgi:hypothetical protein